MFDSWTKSKFYVKCKSLIKVTKARVDGMIKKKMIIVKYLKNDIADLLKTGLDHNAYGRTEGLLVELNAISRYEMLSKFCQCIAASLKDLDKQKDCLESCEEAVQSLVFSAARFAEFPELRDLRALFVNKYGSVSDSFVNKEFAAKLEPLTMTKEMKLQITRDIAKEFSVDWNSKSLEQKVVALKDEENVNLGNTERGRNVDSQRRDDYKTSSLDETCSSASSTLTDCISEEGDGGERRRDLGFLPPPYVRPRNDEKQKVNEQTVPKPSPRSVRSRPRKVLGSVENGDAARAREDGSVNDEGMGSLLTFHGRVKESKRVSSFTEHTNGEKQVPMHARSTSMQQPQLSAAVHVHPNLPDYENLAARLAALQGR